MFDYVRLLNCSITEHSIAFDWQNFFVSSIKFDYQTQSSDWVRLTTSGMIDGNGKRSCEGGFLILEFACL